MSEDRAMSTPVRATLVHAGMRDDMADRWAPLIEAAIARDGDGFGAAPRAATEPPPNRIWRPEAEYPDPAPEPALTRERLAAALYEALNATRVGPDYPESLALADAILAVLVTPPSSPLEETP